jgi:hypothetical protein
MKRNHMIAAVLLLTAYSAMGQSAAQKSFDTMKSLAGNWEGKNSMGKVEVSYRSTAAGSALVGEIFTEMRGESEDMISMIHLDGDRLLLTHYCAAGNQPRMQASMSPDGKTITFDFVDSTNLMKAGAGHMQRVIFTFTDATHHSEEWHFVYDGKEQVETFELQKKS